MSDKKALNLNAFLFNYFLNTAIATLLCKIITSQWTFIRFN